MSISKHQSRTKELKERVAAIGCVFELHYCCKQTLGYDTLALI